MDSCEQLQSFYAGVTSGVRVSEAAQLSGLPLIDEFKGVERLYQRCRAQELGFTLPDFAAMLADVLRRSFPGGCDDREREAFLDSLRLNELVLAHACVRGHEKAWERFLFLYREKLYRIATGIAGQASIGRELADSLYAELFGTRTSPDGRRISKLESYTGRGSLEGWLRIVLSQEYVNRHRSERRQISFEDGIEVEGNAPFQLPHKQRELDNATDVVLGRLSSEERFVLAAYYLDGRTLAELGAMLGVHESTMSRRLEKLTRDVRRRIVEQLCSHGICRHAAEEMLASDVRDLEVDVRARLARGGSNER